MSKLEKQLEKVRNKPYRTRVKILWTAVIIAAILILIIWVLTLELRKPETAEDSNGVQKVGEIFNNLKNFKN